MSIDNYITLLTNLGTRVVQTESGYWSEKFPHVYMNFPLHRPLTPSNQEVREVLGMKGVVVRYTCPVGTGRESYALALSDKDYDLSSLPQKGRNRTRRGLEACSVKQIRFKELENLGGVRLAADSLRRQGRSVPPDLVRKWRQYIAVADKLDTMEAWGAFVNGRLAAFLTCSTIEDRVYIWALNSDSQFLKANPNNALFFVFIQDAISRPWINEVSTGLESTQSDPAGVERFKIRMGFQRKPIGQRVEFNHFCRPMLWGPVGRRLAQTLSRCSEDGRLSKLGTLLQWHAEQPAQP